jgi:glyoxylase-like metal-dependent hydrolase (beta-lactamase superfamily II)
MLMPSLHMERNAAPGVHRIEDAHTNWYLVEDGERVTIVDTGFPRSWNSLVRALRETNRRPSQIDAVVLTHAHFDHMGFARRAQQELKVPVMAHAEEVPVVAHPWSYRHERSRVPYFRHPKFVQIFSEMTAMGALLVKGTTDVTTYAGGQRLDVPGRPEVIETPGHTYGHCSLLFADRGALIAGDAFVMLDPYTGRDGPCIVAGAATADSRAALASLDALAGVSAETALTGHGPAWRGDLKVAVERARAAGAA